MAGKIGDYVAIARKYGNDWFIGAMADWTPRTLSLPLDFLDETRYSAVIYADGNDAKINPMDIIVMKTKVTLSDTLTAKLASGGGYVVYLKLTNI